MSSPNFVGQDRACSIFDDFVGRLFVYRTTNFVYVAMVIVYNRRWILILVIHCVCYYFRSLDAKKVMQVLFCDPHSAVVLAVIVRSSRWKYRPCVMVHWFCRPILSGNLTTPTKVGRLCRSSDIPLTLIFFWGTHSLFSQMDAAFEPSVKMSLASATGKNLSLYDKLPDLCQYQPRDRQQSFYVTKGNDTWDKKILWAFITNSRTSANVNHMPDDSHFTSTLIFNIDSCRQHLLLLSSKSGAFYSKNIKH